MQMQFCFLFSLHLRLDEFIGGGYMVMEDQLCFLCYWLLKEKKVIVKSAMVLLLKLFFKYILKFLKLS